MPGLFAANDLRADESLLTGESVPVDKTAADGDMPAARPGGDGLPFVYAGTMLVQGQGSAEVVAIGAQTEFGRIGKALQSIDSTPTRLQRETGAVVRRLAAGGLLLCALVVLIYGLTRGDWLAGFLAGVTLAMAILPEEFPVVLTVFLALGAWRISRHGVLTRHMPAIETLGSATVLCVDKTGTLTLNQMTVKRLVAGGEQYDVEPETDSAAPERLREVVDFGMLASEARPVRPDGEGHRRSRRAPQSGKNTGRQHWLLVKEYPLTTALLAHAHGWNTGVAGDPCVVAIKGAPEAVAGLCRLNEADRTTLQLQIARMAGDGLRVLGVARAAFRGDAWPASPAQFEFEWLGLIGLADPVRPTVAAAVRECQGGRHPGRHDHRRLPGDCARDRAPGRPRKRRHDYRPRTAVDE